MSRFLRWHADHTGQLAQAYTIAVLVAESLEGAERVQEKWAATFFALDRTLGGEGPLLLCRGSQCTVVLRAEKQVLSADLAYLQVLEQTGHRRRHQLTVEGVVFALGEQVLLRLLRVLSSTGIVGVLAEVAVAGADDAEAASRGQLERFEASLNAAAAAGNMGGGHWERAEFQEAIPVARQSQASVDLALALAQYYVPRRSAMRAAVV